MKITVVPSRRFFINDFTPTSQQIDFIVGYEISSMRDITKRARNKVSAMAEVLRVFCSAPREIYRRSDILFGTNLHEELHAQRSGCRRIFYWINQTELLTQNICKQPFS